MPLAALVVVVLVVGTAACSSGKSGDSAEKSAANKQNSTATTAEPAAGKDARSDATVPGGVDVMPVPVVGPVEKPVKMTETASFGNGVEARVAEMKSFDVKASLPGETSGPAKAVTIEIANNSDKPIDLTSVTVDLTDGEGRSFNLIASAEEQKDFSGVLKSGSQASATYVFRVPPSESSDDFLTIKYSTDTPTVIFTGSITNG